MASCAAGNVAARCKVFANELYNTSSTSELLPLPLTPVTTVNVPSGIRMLTFRKLLCRAPTTSIQPPAGGIGCAPIASWAELPVVDRFVFFAAAGAGTRRDFAGFLPTLSIAASAPEGSVMNFARRFVGTAIAFSPDKYGPVTDPFALPT